MFSFLHKILFLTLITAYLTGEGLFVFVPLVSVVIIGLAIARNSQKRAILLSIALIPGLILGVIAGAIPWNYETMLLCVATFISSVLFGVSSGLALRKYSWGRCLMLSTGAIFIVFTLVTVWSWDELRKDITISINARINEIKEMSSNQEGDTSENSSTILIEGLKYLDYHWEDFHLGLVFGQSLILALLITGSMISRLRAFPTEDGINIWENPNLGSFAQVQPTDYLVWLVILSAILIIYDQHYGISEILRLISRNLAVSVSFVYWLNGLSILTFCALIFQWNIIITWVVVVFVFGVWSFPLLATIGFFDTWWEFRNVILRLYNRIHSETTA